MKNQYFLKYYLKVEKNIWMKWNPFHLSYLYLKQIIVSGDQVLRTEALMLFWYFYKVLA